MFWTNIAIYFLLTIYVVDCLFLGLVIMMQRSKQEGLGAAFGGGFTDSVWGAQTSQVLVKATVWAAVIFFVVSIVLARLYSHREGLVEAGSPLQQELMKPVAVPATKSPAMVPATNSTPALSPSPATNAVAPATTVPATAQPIQPAVTPLNPPKTPGK